MPKTLTTTAVFQSEPEGGYTVTVPGLPGVISYGETIERAEANVLEAIRLHIENLRAHHHDVDFNIYKVFTSHLNVEIP